MDYRDLLRQKYDDRKRLNPQYSLRAFARQLCISSSTLIEVMNGTHNFSVTMGEKIAKNLKLNSTETSLFLTSVNEQIIKKNAKKDIAMNLSKIRISHKDEDLERIHSLLKELLQTINNKPKVSQGKSVTLGDIMRTYWKEPRP